MRFSAIFKPTALFSLRDSNSTSSGAKSLFLPSPYAIKMAFLNQAITLGGEAFNEDIKRFEVVRDTVISYYIKGNFCVNNSFIKIQRKRDNEPYKSTVSFREYVYIDNDIEIIFDVSSSEDIDYLKRYLHTINYFGKRGCFFQFVRYNENPPTPNVEIFDVKKNVFGVLQEYDDFEKKLTFDNVNSYSEAKSGRWKKLLVLPIKCKSSSKSYTCYTTFQL